MKGEKSEIGGVLLISLLPDPCLITASIIGPAISSAGCPGTAASIASAMRASKRIHALSRHPQGAAKASSTSTNSSFKWRAAA